ncbi:MAG TPA: NAD(P)/FAD-dependent oxidoreductase [Kofleriaceae bacterium]|nr:NAD(P)/FAD-dependent oxidoreductase [Kofleriaceae bacterium]
MAGAALDVAVIGCGTAGAAAALFLARAGHRVSVFERVARPGPVGAGILLQPTGQAVLARLGLLDQVRARAAPVDRLLCVRRDGGAVVDLDYGELGGGAIALGTHRGLLFEVLGAALAAEARATLRVDCAVERIAAPVRGRRALVGPGGADLGDFDLVAVGGGADGAALLRGHVGARVSHYPWGALWFVARDPERAFRDRLHQVVDGARRMVGLLPTGLAPGADTPVVSLFWSARVDRMDQLRRAGLARWKEAVLALEPRAAPVLAQIGDLDQLLLARYSDVRLRRWHGDGIAALGDAAHATSPQLGQGANLALWDAMVLADSLAAAATLEAGLAAYSRSRRAHLRYYQLATRWLTPLFQSDSRAGGWLRDRLLPLACRFGPTRRLMLETMAGVRRGLLRRSLAPGDSPP